MTQPHDRFCRAVDLRDQLVLVLAAHWISLQLVIGPDTVMRRWLRHLNPAVDASHTPYNRFPIWVEEQMDRDPDFFSGRE
jgi:hypothetical protein